jgi:hypothetical protein
MGDVVIFDGIVTVVVVDMVEVEYFMNLVMFAFVGN